MKNNIYIPKKIKIGYVKREGTYTKKLAYVIYYDDKGTLRKETSWEGWRDKKIKPDDYDNKPTEGFVLNKKVGGYDTGWNHRNTYSRVYDPRGFEFEISVENLLYILENTSCIKGKGLEGEFVYGWDGKDLILIPCGTPDYIELTAFNSLKREKKKFKEKDLVIGGEYLNNKNQKVIYMGKFLKRGYDCIAEDYSYFFAVFVPKDPDDRYDRSDYDFLHYEKINGKLLDVIDDACVENYEKIYKLMVKDCYRFSKRDASKDVYTVYNIENIKKYMLSYGGTSVNFYVKENGVIKRKHVFNMKNDDYGCRYGDSSVGELMVWDITDDENYKTDVLYSTEPEYKTKLFNEFSAKYIPMYLTTYDDKGKCIERHTRYDWMI